LETAAEKNGLVKAGCGWTDIFLYPPYRPKVTDMLLTNFHLPKSSLLMLVSTFAERENILKAYREAVEAKLRFYSYGDCMLLV
jgi:S-adenosylmethionine:tRNA ribosyltransferase-isomerase